MGEEKLKSKIKKETKLLDEEVNSIARDLAYDDYDIVFLRDPEKFKEKITLQKDNPNELSLRCIVQEGKVIQGNIKLGVKEPYTQPEFNPENLLSVVITTRVFEDENFIEESKELLIYLPKDCNRNNYNNF
jgi:hypothetical protein